MLTTLHSLWYYTSTQPGVTRSTCEFTKTDEFLSLAWRKIATIKWNSVTRKMAGKNLPSSYKSASLGKHTRTSRRPSTRTFESWLNCTRAKKRERTCRPTSYTTRKVMWIRHWSQLGETIHRFRIRHLTREHRHRLHPCTTSISPAHEIRYWSPC